MTVRAIRTCMNLLISNFVDFLNDFFVESYFGYLVKARFGILKILMLIKMSKRKAMI